MIRNGRFSNASLSKENGMLARFKNRIDESTYLITTTCDCVSVANWCGRAERASQFVFQLNHFVYGWDTRAHRRLTSK
jgi:hypothetical protein